MGTSFKMNMQKYTNSLFVALTAAKHAQQRTTVQQSHWRVTWQQCSDSWVGRIRRS